ncbi:MAG: metallophosphoesterase family protein [Candidatus Bathyarchaeota archaeon]|nr:MAG: metallophosphoesterase family protein [Candidatus Bathyarchaeota archaeon]
MSLKQVGLISDTHIPARAKAIPNKVFEVFQDASLILHAGDLTRVSVLEELEQMAPVIAVHGNMDARKVKERLPTINSVDVYDWKIGVTHSLNFFFRNSGFREITEKRGFHVFVSGHTHRPGLKYKSGMLLINPGSPTNPIPPFITRSSVALLKITKKEIEPEIINL